MMTKRGRVAAGLAQMVEARERFNQTRAGETGVLQPGDGKPDRLATALQFMKAEAAKIEAARRPVRGY